MFREGKYFNPVFFFYPADSLKGMSLGKSGGNNKATNPSFKYEFTMDITNHIYTDALLNHNSPKYELLSTQVTGVVSFSLWFCSWLESLRTK